jgi:hypothetical protein
MADDKWILLAEAADFLGTPDAERILNLAWKLRKQCGFRFRGVCRGESEPVEIPFSEDAQIDCAGSCVGEGTLLTKYRRVQIAWVDVKRLAQADVNRLAQEAKETAALDALPTERAPQGASDADILEAKAGPLVEEVAIALRRHFPEGPPRGWTRDRLMHYVHEKSEKKIEVFSPATLDRARALAWPRAKRSHAPEAAKPPR